MGESFYDHKHSQKKMVLWSQRIMDCKSSGLPVNKWCAQNDVEIKSYWRWHKILKDKYTEYSLAAESTPDFYEVNLVEPNNISRNPVATIRIGSISADLYSCDERIITAICRAMKSC